MSKRTFYECNRCGAMVETAEIPKDWAQAEVKVYSTENLSLTWCAAWCAACWRNIETMLSEDKP